MSEQCNIDESCCNGHGHENSDDCNMPEKFLSFADDAWCELFKDHLKKEIESSCGDKMQKLAKLVADANAEKMGNMMKGKMICEEYTQNLKNLFSEACKE